MKHWNVSWSLVVFLIKPTVHGFVHPPIQYANYQPRLSIKPFFGWARYGQKNIEQQHQESAPTLPTLTQVDVIYGSTTSLVYDENEGRFLPKEMIRNKLDEIQIDTSKISRFILSPLLKSPPVTFCRKIMAYHVKPYLTAAFVPAGVTPAYYRYTTWRFLQRWINANLQVFGTQSLLLGLGIKTKSLAALSAALNWVLKDALGKIVRMFWASKMGGRFDSDAKRWRMRASFLYAFGNGLEIATYVVPQLFLLFATSANCCKQMAMLTCSSTRSSLYNSFRDGTRENIGDITAKGEATIAAVDLLGIATGVSLSRALGASIRAVLPVYLILQTMEIFCIYRMMRTVQFRVLNFERLVQVLQDFIGDAASSQPAKAMPAVNPTNENATAVVNGSDPFTLTWKIKTPEEMADTEKILKPPDNLARRAIAFGSLSRARISPEELTQLLEIFEKERFLLVVGKNMKKQGWVQRLRRRSVIEENCHIVLHVEATNADIVKSSLALVVLRQKLSQLQDVNPDLIRSGDCLDLLRESCQKADRLLPRLLRQLANKGWTSPARFMFGRVTMRADWPLKSRQSMTNGEKPSQPKA